LGVVCAAAMMPEHPASLLRPLARLGHEVAAVRSDQEIGAGEYIESVSHARPGAAVVKHDRFGHEGPAPDSQTPAMSYVLDGLLETRCGLSALTCVATGERHRGRENQGAVGG